MFASIDTIPFGMGLETANFHTPMCVMLDMIPDVLVPRRDIVHMVRIVKQAAIDRSELKRRLVYADYGTSSWNSILTGHSCTGSQADTITTGDTGSETLVSAIRGKLWHVHVCLYCTVRMCSLAELLIHNCVA